MILPALRIVPVFCIMHALFTDHVTITKNSEKGRKDFSNEEYSLKSVDGGGEVLQQKFATKDDSEQRNRVPRNVDDDVWSLSEQEKSNYLLNLYQTDDTLGQLFSNITEFCPEWSPCKTSRVISDDSMPVCCLTCTCAKSCLSKRSCCPGFIPQVNQNETHVDFENISKICMKSVFFTDEWNILDSAAEFDMIVSCPESTSINLKSKCTATLTETDGSFIHKFLDVIPVTDSLTLTTFANGHCAACNGLTEDRFIFWNPIVGCRTALFHNTETLERDVQTEDGCHLNVKPPSYEIGNVTQCFLGVISMCNVTGLWDVYDPKVEYLCREIDWLFFPPDVLNQERTRYKNMFCAICNGDDYKEGIGMICPGGNAEVLVQFTALLNIRPDPEWSPASTQNTDDNPCQPGEKLDPISKQCKDVICSHPQFLNYITMTCEDTYLYVRYGSVEYPFEVVLDTPIPLIDVYFFQYYFTSLLVSINQNGNCNFYDIYYKLNVSYDSIENRDIIDNLEVASIILVAYVDLGFPNKRSAREVLDDFLTINSSIDIFDFHLTYRRSDTYFLPSAMTGNANNTKMAWYQVQTSEERKKRTTSVQALSVYEDPYDRTAIFRKGQNFYIPSCFDTNFLYRKSYFECPSFVYDVNVNVIQRRPGGIMMKENGVAFDFGEFSSINDTHIVVCLDALERRGLVVSREANVNQSSVCVPLCNAMVLMAACHAGLLYFFQ